MEMCSSSNPLHFTPSPPLRLENNLWKYFGLLWIFLIFIFLSQPAHNTFVHSCVVTRADLITWLSLNVYKSKSFSLRPVYRTIQLFLSKSFNHFSDSSPTAQKDNVVFTPSLRRTLHFTASSLQEKMNLKSKYMIKTCQGGAGCFSAPSSTYSVRPQQAPPVTGWGQRICGLKCKTQENKFEKQLQFF